VVAVVEWREMWWRRRGLCLVQPKPTHTLHLLSQITASVTFLPLLTRPCTFDLLIYADRDASVPVEWEDSDARMIEDAETVRLRSFTTKVHRVDALVAYKADVEDVC
jgi:mitotic spindle assembly checkpoint protein MAD2